MHHASNEKWQVTHDRRSRTTKSSSNQNARRKGNLQILGNIGSWHHRTNRNQRKNLKRVPQKDQRITKDKTLQQKPCLRDKYTAVPLVRYLRPFLKLTGEELTQMDQRKRKLMTMHKQLHPRDDVDRLYVSRRKGGKELASIEASIDTLTQQLKDSSSSEKTIS